MRRQMKLLRRHGIRRVGKAGDDGGGGRRWCGGEGGRGIGVLAEKLSSCFSLVCLFVWFGIVRCREFQGGDEFERV